MTDRAETVLYLALGAIGLVLVMFWLMWWTMSAWGKVVVEMEKTPMAGMVRSALSRGVATKIMFNPPRHGLSEAAERAIVRFRKRAWTANVAQILLVIAVFVIFRKVIG